MSLPAVHQHVAVLEASGLVSSTKVGRVRICRIEPPALDTASQWMQRRRSEWEQRLDRLDEYLTTFPPEGSENP